MRWSVRRAEDADAAEIARINIASWRDSYQGLVPDEALAVLDMDEVATSYRDLLRSAHADIFLACRNGAIGAFCHVCPVREPDRDAHPELTTAELTALYADPHARGTGAGHVAHEAGLLHLASSGFEYAVLWVLRDHNPAQVFYQRQGWSSDHVAREAEVSGAAVPMLRWSRPVS